MRQHRFMRFDNFQGRKKCMSKEASRTTKSEATKECWNRRRQHGRHPKELCPAAGFGKTCDCCGKQNHFAKKCRQKRSGRTRNSVRVIGEPIRLDDAVDHIQHAPCRVPVALRGRLKATMDDMARYDIIEAVEKKHLPSGLARWS